MYDQLIIPLKNSNGIIYPDKGVTYLEALRERSITLEAKYAEKLIVNQDLARNLVSFQANKKTPGYRWYKFKEGYSSALVYYILDKMDIAEGRLLDPFAGSGTSVFAAEESGLSSVGIELLPIGQEIIEVRKIIQAEDRTNLINYLNNWISGKPWKKVAPIVELNEIRITAGAYPSATKKELRQYLTAINDEPEKKKKILRFALLCILESISYTRKDGQYLRWDTRAGKRRGAGRGFNKGLIDEFDLAITTKLGEIVEDLSEVSEALVDFLPGITKKGKSIQVLSGSCLNLLKTLSDSSFDILMTSPPYCNRYDYTRTYALELALLGIDEVGIRDLRQTMMSCTVENRDKEGLNQLFSTEAYESATKAFDNHKQLQEILDYLNQQRLEKILNNSGIVRMVRNYFYEMALIIFESARILKQGAPFVMVNDNVRYAGANIPVDLILSDFAEKAGFEVEAIWVLPTGKGNSSQQMGAHGREQLRKCVYVWRKL